MIIMDMVKFDILSFVFPLIWAAPIIHQEISFVVD